MQGVSSALQENRRLFAENLRGTMMNLWSCFVPLEDIEVLKTKCDFYSRLRGSHVGPIIASNCLKFDKLVHDYDH